MGLKFYRQKVIGPYIVDFYCPEKKLIIELDGSQHSELIHEARDQMRDLWFQGKGYTVLRLWNNQLKDLESAFEYVLKLTASPLTRPSGTLSPGGEGM